MCGLRIVFASSSDVLVVLELRGGKYLKLSDGKCILSVKLINRFSYSI